ncbi:MAG: hypothetical protein CMK56_02875 [Proteobacteria bacterium]|nr:hypothetical protein [Pseudomonadota bacterium]
MTYSDQGKESKTQKKKRALSVRRLSNSLVCLADNDLKQIGLPENIFDAICDLRKINKHSAQRRQKLFISGLLRKINYHEIEVKLKMLLQKQILHKKGLLNRVNESQIYK